MDYLYYSIIGFNICTFGYLLASIFLTIYLVKPKEWLKKAFLTLGVVSVCSHTVALALRWIEAGFDRPPWTNLYESLIFFSWGLGLISTVVVVRYRTYFLATLLYPLTFAGLGLAALVPDKTITPLVPSLQSYWIKIHVVMATVAYPSFIIAATISLAYLFKKRVFRLKLGFGFSLITLLVLIMTGGYDVFLHGVFQIPQMVLENGKWFKIPVDPMANPPEWVLTLIPVAGKLFLFTALIHLFVILYSLAGMRDRENLLWQRMEELFQKIGLASFVALMFVIYYNFATRQDLNLASNPYEMVLLWMALFAHALYVVYSWKPQAFEKLLPSAEWLDEFAYKMTLFAFPFMTLLLITGAIWAYSAWGRYWGWDPKETCALMTWLIFAGYLHSRKYFLKNATPSAVINIIGGISVFFTFLGANLLLSGLHAYGAQ